MKAAGKKLTRAQKVAQYLRDYMKTLGSTVVMAMAYIDDVQKATGLRNVGYSDLDAGARLCKPRKFVIQVRPCDEYSDEPYVTFCAKAKTA
jgi:hypothetical protein